MVERIEYGLIWEIVHGGDVESKVVIETGKRRRNRMGREEVVAVRNKGGGQGDICREEQRREKEGEEMIDGKIADLEK